MNGEANTNQNYIFSISHELKAPINVITGSCQIAHMYIDDRDKVSQCLSKISVASNHLTELINNVLAMADTEQSQLGMNCCEFDMNCLLDELLMMVQPPEFVNNVHIRIDSSEIIHSKVIGDYRRILQVMVNIISNSIKYNCENKDIFLRITEKNSPDSPSESTYRFICRDKGIGMSEEFLSKIFEPFARSDDAVNSDIKGSGLGMSIVKKLLDMMGGKIQITSRKGSGTIVTVDIRMGIVPKNSFGEHH